jgi:DNA-binding HxlR family transcriptional regulator
MEQLQERKNLSLEHIDVTAPASHEPSSCRRDTPVLNRVGDKWSMQIVMALSSGPRRFSELKRELDGVSQRMLTLSQPGLQRHGHITRHVTPSIPPRVDYELTELGISLREPVKALGQWALDHIDCIWAAQQRFDEAQDREPGASTFGR